MKKLILILYSMFFISLYGFAQSRVVQGKVISQDGTPLAGATVTAVKEGKSSITDAKGNFTLSVEANDSLAISYIGFTSAQVSIKPGQNPGTITLEQSSIGSLSEVVVTGYQTQKKVDLTGSVAIVD